MNKEQLLGFTDLAAKPMEVGGQTFYIRSMSAAEMVDFETAINAAQGEPANVKRFLAIQLAAFLADASGERLLTEEEASEVMGKLRASTVTRIVEEGMTFNALNQKGHEEVRGN